MKPVAAFALGLVTGLGLFALSHPWKTSRPSSAISAPSTPPAAASANESSAIATSDASSAPDTPSPPAALESALREIQEAGMVVIPQEFARFLMPSLLSTHPEPAVRQILQLDDREAKALANARINFDRVLQQTIDARLKVIDVKDGIITASLPAFPEERQQLIAAWRAESLAALDADSAAMAAHIDFDRAMDGFFQGRVDLAVTFKPSPDAPTHLIEYRGQTTSGDRRQNYRLQTGVPNSQLLKKFPSLQPHFPQRSTETKP